MKKSKLLCFFMMLMLAVALSCLFILSTRKVNSELNSSDKNQKEKLEYKRGPDTSFVFVLISSAISVVFFKLISKKEKRVLS